MAKKSTKPAARSEESDLPAGFDPVNSSRGDGWYHPESGAEIYGELLGRFKKKKSLDPNKDAFLYQILLEKPCPATKKVEEETTEVELEPGDVINVDEKSALEGLAALCDTGKRYRVFIQAQDKVKIPGTAQSFWNFRVGKQEIIPGKNEPTIRPRNSDIPF